MKDIRSKYKDFYQQFPKISEWKKLWHCNFWDGPLSGVCEVDNKKCWFECIEEWHDNNHYPEVDGAIDDDFEPPWYRRFAIVQLTDQQFQELERRHDKFRRMVGTHCDYDDAGNRGTFHYNDTITEATLKQFYEEFKSEEPMKLEPASDAHILGWYEY